MGIEAYSLTKNGTARLSQNFRVREFKCKDGSDPIFIDQELVGILQKVRDHYGQAVHITSGFRTASHNAKTKGASIYSQHLYGRAADFWVENVRVEEVAKFCETLLPGRGGIGIYPKEGHPDRKTGWVHVDVRNEKKRWTG